MSLTARWRLSAAPWQQRCKSAGEFIHQSIADVDGIVLRKVRYGNNRSQQFTLDDPYGPNSTGDTYLRNFLQGFYTPSAPVRLGYRFVEAGDPEHGRAFRYTGRFEEPWQTNKSYRRVTFVL